MNKNTKGGFHKGVRLFSYVKRFIDFIKSSFYKKRFMKYFSEDEYYFQLLKLEDLCISFKLMKYDSDIYGISNGKNIITLNVNACTAPLDTVIHELCHIWKFPLPFTLGNDSDYWSSSEEIRCRLMVILYKMWLENLSPSLAYVELFDDIWLIYKREEIVKWLEVVI